MTDRTEENRQAVGSTLERELGCDVEISDAGPGAGLAFQPVRPEIGTLSVSREVLMDEEPAAMAAKIPGIIVTYLLGGTSGLLRHSADGGLEFVPEG